MKAKKILITYLNNGNLQSQVAKEYLFQRVLGQLLTEGRIASDIINMKSSKEIKFEDGSEIKLIPVGSGSELRGFRCTHMYIDQNITHATNGNEALLALKQAVIRGEYLNYDTSDEHRAFTFSFDNGQINLTNI